MKRISLLLIAALSTAFALEPPPARKAEANAKAAAAPVEVTNEPVFTAEEDTRPFSNTPDAGGLSVSGNDSPLQPYNSIDVSFPAAMVSSDKVDAENQPSPVVAWPKLDATWTWRSPTEGSLMINGPLVPGQTYRFRLTPGLTDLSGKALPVDAWGFEAKTDPLRIVESGYGGNDSLSSQPQVRLEFNFPIRLATAASGVWFQDRVTRVRFPAELLLNRAQGVLDAKVVDVTADADTKVYDFRVRPLSPLPVNRRFDLVVDGIQDAYAGRTLPYPNVIPLGTTEPLSILTVAAANRPMEKPRIEIKFDEWLGDDPLPPKAVKITPEVPHLQLRKDGQFIYAEGDFDRAIHYTVEIDPAIRGNSGYGLARAERWGATFRPFPGTVIFPDREVRLRSVLGLSFAFYQFNTSELTWRIAPIPLDKLTQVQAAEKEFTQPLTDETGNQQWTEEGNFRYAPSQPLIETLQLAPIGSGTFPASTDQKEVLREIAWKPDTAAKLDGPMLLEVTGKDSKGRVIGNRAIIYFGEAAITRKVSAAQTAVRIARMTDAQPVAGATVSALDSDLREITSATTNAEGIASWPTPDVAGAQYYLAKADGISTLQPVRLSDQLGSGSLSAVQPPPLRAFTFTDRPLYRPGQPVQFKGIIRQEKDGGLTIPAGTSVTWRIEKQYGSQEAVAEGTAKLDAEGSWNGQWTPAEGSAVGDFVVRCLLSGTPVGDPAQFKVEEFRNPPFNVICEEAKVENPAESVITVSSQYFHGAPNAGSRVKWTATWVSDSSEGYYNSYTSDDMTRADIYSEDIHIPTYVAQISGETALDGNGHAILRCKAPFPDPGNRAFCSVSWNVEVTGPDGQTIPGGASQIVPMGKVLLGVKNHDRNDGTIAFAWDALTPFGSAPDAVNIELFHVVTRSVKERLAPNVYRYRNFDQYISVEKKSRVTQHELSFEPKEPGRYVLVVSPIKDNAAFPVSEDAYLEGPAPAQVPVQSDNTATVFSRAPSDNISVDDQRPGDRPWKVGETASVRLLSSTGGIAWVTVETDHILDTFTVPVPANSTRIDIPIKPEYEPNVTVSVYLLRPGGTDELAGEIYGSTTLFVRQPDRVLSVDVKTSKPEYKPREFIYGRVAVTAQDKPVANADLAIYAVDDSILELGEWHLPVLLPAFFPSRPLGVVTYSSLRAYVDKINPRWLTMKGFTAGDGGDDAFANTTFARKEFKPIILWQPNVKTNAEGIASFQCEAPDNLTRFRVIAVAQTRESQFGAGDATLTVTKNLLLDTALPRFVREGDEVELRAVARQKLWDSAKLKVRCMVGGGLELTGPTEQEISADRDAPSVVRFRAKASAVGSATVKFDVVALDDTTVTDSVEVPIPIAEPVILRKDAVAGTVGSTTFKVAEVAPGAWENAKGDFTFSISTTPWLPKLQGIPYLIEYPHGCFEQKSSRLLAYTYLGGLLKYIPDAGVRKENYQDVITRTLEEFEQGLLSDGRLPYWPGGTTANDFVTIQAAWCVSQAEAAGFEVPERLASELPAAVTNMVLQQNGLSATPTLRAFAFFTLASFGNEPDAALKSAANELYLQRDKMGTDGKAMLALGLSLLKLEPEKQKTIVSELPRDPEGIAFNPETFSSQTRTRALCDWARLVITPGPEDKEISDRLGKLLESAQSLSTQENLWLLVTFNTLLDKTSFNRLRANRLKPAAATISENSTAAAWSPQTLANLATFVIDGLPKSTAPGSFMLSAAYRTGQRETPAEIHGMKIERIVKNLTAPDRDGSVTHPYKLGDQVLISYRFSAEEKQSFVALEDMIPAGLEIVNPNLALFGRYYDIPAEGDVSTASLSHSEIRDQQTNLYFDRVDKGRSSYSVLARATAAGNFIWPATQIVPMYDSRFFGRSASSQCAVVSE